MTHRAAPVAALLVAACAAAAPSATPRIEVPAPRPAPPAAPAKPPEPAIARVVLEPEPVDVATLAAPTELWSVPASARVEAVRAPSGRAAIAALPDERGVELVDADTGKRRWTRRAANGERWRALAAGTQDGAGFLAVQGTDARDRRVLVRLDPATGKLLEHRTIAASVDLERGEHGGLELVDRDRCEVSILDALTGKRLGAPVAGSLTATRDFRGRPGGVCRNTVALHELSSGVATASFLKDGTAQLIGLSATGTLWRHPVTGQVVDLLDADADGSLFASLAVTPAATSSLVRIERATGRVVFERAITGAAACGDAARVRSVPGPPGHERAALVQSCADVTLVDARSGAALWTARARGLALIENEPTRAIAPGAVGTVEWFSTTGTSIGRFALPEGTSRIRPLAAGLLVENAGRDVIALIAEDASVRFQYRLPWSRLSVQGDRVVLVSGARRVWIEPRDGSLLAAAAPAPWSVGHAATDVSVWIDQGAAPDVIRALRLPSSP